MNQLVGELNNDQLDGLANLCFDLAKASFILAIIPSSEISVNFIYSSIKILLSLFWGIACTYAALVLLKLKKDEK